MTHKNNDKFDSSGFFASLASGTAILSFPLVINLCSPLDNGQYCAVLEQQINQDLKNVRTGYISVNCEEQSPRYYFRDSFNEIVDEGHFSGKDKIVTDGGDTYQLMKNKWTKVD